MIAGRECARITEIDGAIDLALIAAPNALHFPLAAEALNMGAHVLVEKPFVLNPSDGRALIDLAKIRDRVLAVNQTRRFFPFVAELRSRIRGGEFGSLHSIVHHEGVKLVWPFESGAAFAPSAQRTGSIMDFGVHAIDLYHFLLDPDWSFVSAIHDGFEGPEGLAEIDLLASGAPVSLRLSRYCQQENTAHMHFERAEVSFNVHGADGYGVLWRDGRHERRTLEGLDDDQGTLADRVLLDFMAAAEGHQPSTCSAESTLPVIDILDDIYRRAGTYEATPGYV
jgi:predicted dehydrogenase